MCGIFGIVQNKPGIDPALVQELVEANLSRGDLGWGIFAWSPPRSMVYRSTEKWEPYTLHIPGTLDAGTDLSWAQMVVGHVRAPTSGDRRLLDTHPFETPRFLLAMNGIFTKVARTSTESDVDSAHLAWHLEDRYFGPNSPHVLTIPDRISGAMEDVFEGQAACWLWDKREERLFLFRATNPIKVWVDDLENDTSRLAFSSASNNPSASNLGEGTIYWVDRKEVYVRPCGTFRTDSIYKFLDEDPSVI